MQLDLQYLSLLTLVLMGVNMKKRQGFNNHIKEQELLSVKYLLCVEHLCQKYLLKYLNNLPISCRSSILSGV